MCSILIHDYKNLPIERVLITQRKNDNNKNKVSLQKTNKQTKKTKKKLKHNKGVVRYRRLRALVVYWVDSTIHWTTQLVLIALICY